MFTRCTLFISLLFLSNLLFGQRQNFRSRSEFGIMGGGMYYIGDLNPTKHFEQTQLSGSIFYRYAIHSRLAFRMNYTYGSVEADDKRSKDPGTFNRNLSFQSKINEFGAGIEFSYFAYEVGHRKHKATAYLLAEIAVFEMNPTAEYQGNTYNLQPLGTEGQGTELSEAAPYSLTQLAIPLGVGGKLNLGKRATLGLEYSIRYLFTDYLDDVGSYDYVDKQTLSDINGPVAAGLSNRTRNNARFSRRGNPATRDWYSFFGMNLSIRIGNPDKCPQRY